MFSIQEICDKYTGNLKNVRDLMDRTATFHPEEASVYDGLNIVEQQSIRETLHAIPYSNLKEYLSRGTTIGNYLVADKIHDDLVMYSRDADICPLISAQMVNGWEGGDLIVNISDDESYRAWEFVSGALNGTNTIKTGAKATLSPIGFAVDLRIGEDLVEDTSFNGDLVSWHVKQAAQACGEHASELAVNVLQLAADGVGTLNSSATGDADATKWTGGTTADIDDAKAALTDDRWIANTMLITTEAWQHSVETTYNTLANNIAMPYVLGGVPAGFDCRLGIPALDTKFWNGDIMHDPSDNAPGGTGAMTNCKTIIFDRNNALLTGRKRWLQIENYAEPFKDLAGAVVSCRQDSVSLYDDSVYRLTET